MKSILFRSLLFSLYSWCFAVLDFLFPKKEGVWLFASHNGLSGNIRFFMEHVLQNNPGVRVYLISRANEIACSGTEEYFEQRYGSQIKTLEFKSLPALAIALQARHVFTSHDLYRDVGYPLKRFGRRRMVVNLWHGIASKKHWLLTKEKVPYSYAARAKEFSAVVASSAADAIAKAAVFGKPLEDIWVTGNPRNDYLILNEQLPRDLADQEQLLLDKVKGRTLIIYAPTWRKFKAEFIPFGEEDIHRLAKMLAKNNAVLGLRLHPKDEDKFAELYANPSIICVSSRLFPETQVVLRNSGLLVTDYSSIWLDYLLLEKPVIAYCYDNDEYKQKMGTIWDIPNLFPGKIAFSPAELQDEIEQLLAGGMKVSLQYRHKYNYTKALFHQYADGQNNQRLLQKVTN